MTKSQLVSPNAEIAAKIQTTNRNSIFISISVLSFMDQLIKHQLSWAILWTICALSPSPEKHSLWKVCYCKIPLGWCLRQDPKWRSMHRTTWGPPGPRWSLVGPQLAWWTLISGREMECWYSVWAREHCICIRYETTTSDAYTFFLQRDASGGDRSWIQDVPKIAAVWVPTVTALLLLPTNCYHFVCRQS